MHTGGRVKEGFKESTLLNSNIENLLNIILYKKAVLITKIQNESVSEFLWLSGQVKG